MNLAALLFVFVVGKVLTQDDLDLKVAAEIELANLELQDDCENYANVLKSSLISNSFNEKLKSQRAHGELLKVLHENLKPYEDNIPVELARNFSFYDKPGDVLLSEKDWTDFVNFGVGIDEFIHTATIQCKNKTENCIYIKKGYDNLIQISRNLTLLKKGWSAWQTFLTPKHAQFPHILSLVNKAAKRNGKDSARDYWEMLVEYDDAYSIADNLWEEIKPFYFKFATFIKSRLFRHYEISEDIENIPVYLLGSNLGSDWSNIAKTVLPHPHLYNLAENVLNRTSVRDVFKMAEELSRNLSLGGFGTHFWSSSTFNLPFCENHVINFCVDEHTELLTCEKVSWLSYLNAFEVGIDVALRNMDYSSLSRSTLRFSPLDEAVKGLGSVFAIKNMRTKGVWPSNLFSDNPLDLQENDMTELLLIALRTLPQLPYYLAADKWRLHLLENGFGSYDEKWWEYRKEYQGVSGVFNREADFLADPYLVSNKPYLSKFLGIILQFQLLEHYKREWQSSNQSIAENIGSDSNFLDMLRQRSSNEWQLLINNNFFYQLSASAILDFFAPLETYFNSAPIDQIIPTTEVVTTVRQETIPRNPNPTSDEINTLIQKPHNNTMVDDEPPMSPHHDHVEENLEGPNPAMENITMYIGIGLLVAVAAIVAFVIISKKMRKRKRNNNRRFET